MLKERLLNDGNVLYILKDRTFKSSRTVRGAQSLYIKDGNDKMAVLKESMQYEILRS